ncbi:hypothetical protein BH11PSE9_BH11PSE9_26480 [soil metagenome]
MELHRTRSGANFAEFTVPGPGETQGQAKTPADAAGGGAGPFRPWC